MQKTLQQKFIKELKDRISDEAKAISMGRAENMHEYGKLCGRVQGLEEALLLFEDIHDEYIKQE